MRGVRAVVSAAVVSACLVALGCLDASGPGGAHNVSLAFYPVFEGYGPLQGAPSDVDSFRISVRNPPFPDTVIVRVLTGQDTAIEVTVPVLVGGGLDTVFIGFQGYNSTTGLLLYSGTQSIELLTGIPAPPRPVQANYVGPGRRIKTLVINPDEAALRPGESQQFTYTGFDSSDVLLPDDSVPVHYVSTNTHVATVSAAGLVTAVANGIVDIIVACVARNSIRDTATVTVSSAPPPLISLSQSAITFNDTAATANPSPQTVIVDNSGGGTLSGLAVGTITYGPGASGWLTASLSGATAPATLTLSASNASLAPGTYTASVPVTASGVSNSPQTVTVTYILAAGPAIALAPATITFNDTATTANPAAQTVSVTNSSGGTLSGLVVGTITYGASQPTGWLTASLSGTTAPATLTLTASNAALSAGTYTATVPVTSAVASNSPQTVSVTFILAAPPLIVLTPGSLTVNDTATTSNPSPRTLSVTNSGGGPLGGLAVGAITYGASQPTGWLTASLSGTATPATLTLNISNAGLAAGTYTATVPVTSALALNSPQSVSVTFVLAPPPLTSITVAPGYSVLLTGGTVTLSVTGKDAVGAPATVTGLSYTSRGPTVATVNATTGVVTAVAGGTAVIVASATGASGAVLDSMTVAVAANGSAVASAIGDTRAFDVARVGDTVRVLVAVDLRGVSPEKLGSYNAQLDWSATALRYVRSDPVPGGFLAPTLNETATSSGQLRFGQANASGSAGPSVGLVTVVFVGNAAGTSALTLTLTDLSASGTFTQLLTQALIYSGSVRIQ